MSSAPAQPAQDPKDTKDAKDTKQPQPLTIASWDPVNGAQVYSNDPTAKLFAAETMHIGSHPPAGSGNHVFAANTMTINTQTVGGRNATNFMFGSGTSMGSTTSPISFMFGSADSMFGGGAAPGHSDSVRWAYEKGAYEKVSHSVTGQLPPYFPVFQTSGFPPLVQMFCGLPIGHLVKCESDGEGDNLEFGHHEKEFVYFQKPNGLSSPLDLQTKEKEYVYFQNKASTMPKAIEILCKTPEDLGQDKCPVGKLTITTYAANKSDCRSHPIQNFAYCGIVSRKGIDRVEIRGLGMDKVKMVVYRNPEAVADTASAATPANAHDIVQKSTTASSSATSVAETASSS